MASSWATALNYWNIVEGEMVQQESVELKLCKGVCTKSLHATTSPWFKIINIEWKLDISDHNIILLICTTADITKTSLIAIQQWNAIMST